MIIIGFPGIGKSSTVAGVNTKPYAIKRYIDLESSMFTKDEDWVKDYCRVAIDLHSQGFNVFVSAHKDVRDYLINNVNDDDLCIVYPCKEYKEIWLKRLINRIETCPEKEIKKNQNAYNYMKEHYIEAVEDAENCSVEHKIVIDETCNINNLSDTLSNYFRKAGF